MEWRIRCCVCVLILMAVSVPGYCGSPYRANGLGIVLPDEFGRAHAMGGAGVADDSDMNISRDNPALLGTFEHFSYSFGALYSFTNTSLSDETINSGKTDPEVIKIAMPLNKYLVVGWGVTPYTRTDVNLRFEGTQAGVTVKDTATLSGGVNTSTAGVALRIRGIHLGYSFNYHFGMIQEEWEREFPGTDDLADSFTAVKRKYKGYSASFGIQARLHKRLSVGAAYTSSADLTHAMDVVLGSLANDDIRVNEVDRKLPSIIRVGVFSPVTERVQVALDYTSSAWNDAAVTARERLMYVDSYRIGAGVRYVPEDRPSATYLKKLPFSAGVKYGVLPYKSYPRIDTVTEAAVTCGVEFPLKNTAGSLATAFEAGIRGNTGSNGWDERFFSFSMSLTGVIK